MAVLAQQLSDHLETCEAQGATTNRRLGRIEGILIAVAGTAILQLIGLVLAMGGYIYTQNLPH